MNSSRRDFFQTIGTGAAGLGLAATLPVSASARADHHADQADDGPILQVGEDIAVASTVYGKVRGFVLRGIHQFRGIPYGADTGGENRFMPPRKPAAWDDVRPALWWGNSAPQLMENRYANQVFAFSDHWNYDDVSEDCLKLNVWTPAIDSGKRPVLVWLHGGGFTNGNGIEQDGYMGENLSRKGDVVFVSINHRLGPIGFSDLSAVGGEKYRDSGNVGALDMVAALAWVQENIANFGGDPTNVTIMGQSGGGAKVCTLAAMPAARGMIHKAVPLSGTTTQSMDQKMSQKLGRYVLEEAGLTPTEVDQLQALPWHDYIEIANRARARLLEEIGPTDFFRFGFGPVADGVHIPKGRFYAEAEGVSADVPMMICSTFHEWGMARLNPALTGITAEQAKDSLKKSAGFLPGFGERAPALFDAYAKAFPDATPYEVMTLVISNRKHVIDTAAAKSTQPAPVYVAWFGWEPPMFDNRMGAFHCLDICFWFDNTDLMYTHTGGGARPRALSKRMSDALLSFMRTGDPNCAALPEWPAYDPANGRTMVLNDDCKVVTDPDREGLLLL